MPQQHDARHGPPILILAPIYRSATRSLRSQLFQPSSTRSFRPRRGPPLPCLGLRTREQTGELQRNVQYLPADKYTRSSVPTLKPMQEACFLFELQYASAVSTPRGHLTVWQHLPIVIRSPKDSAIPCVLLRIRTCPVIVPVSVRSTLRFARASSPGDIQSERRPPANPRKLLTEQTARVHVC